MKGIFAMLSGLGLGALLMYLFDPQGGNRRRALIRDKAVKFNRQARETMVGTAKDISNRAQSVAHDFNLGMKHGDEMATEQGTTGWSDGPAM